MRPLISGVLTHDGTTFVKTTDKNAKPRIYNIEEPTLTLLITYLHNYKDTPALHLFRIASRPHCALGSERFEKLAKQFMQESGIDTNIFKAHSLRGAVATHLLHHGNDIHLVQERGGWASTTTLQQHYNRMHLKQNWAKMLQAPHAKGEDVEFKSRQMSCDVQSLLPTKPANLKPTEEG